MLGGDEVGALVVNLGAHTVKAGYAGDDSPKVVIPSAYGYVAESGRGGKAIAPQDGEGDVDMSDGARASDGALRSGLLGDAGVGYHVGVSGPTWWREGMEVREAVGSDGIVADDLDGLASMLDYIYRTALRQDPSEHPLMFAEPNHMPRDKREVLEQILFEKYNVPALFFAREAMLTAFSTGRSTACVVDVGHAGASVTAVSDGYVIPTSANRTNLAGRALNEMLLYHVEKTGREAGLAGPSEDVLRPRYTFTKRDPGGGGQFEIVDTLRKQITHPSFHTYQRLNIVAEIKESCCGVLPAALGQGQTVAALAASAGLPGLAPGAPPVPEIKQFELPDGRLLDISPDARYRTPELFFNPRIVESFGGEGPSLSQLGGVSADRGLPWMVVDTIQHSDVDLKKELFASVLVTGGSTLIPGFVERLQSSIAPLVPPTTRIKLLANPNPIDRKYSVWIGGSILASLGTMVQMWLSKQEYGEHGAELVHSKCP